MFVSQPSATHGAISRMDSAGYDSLDSNSTLSALSWLREDQTASSSPSVG